jgi:SAM-dependent methyltransferase
MPSLRRRIARTAWRRSRSASRKLSQRGSAAIQRRGPLHQWLRRRYQFFRQHLVSVNQWDAQYAVGDWDRLDSISEVAHNMVVLGYLAYGANAPTILDVGCGHGRFLQLLTSIGFAEYMGIDWSDEAVQRARSLSIPHTQFQVADMDHWDTPTRFDAVVLNECLYYSSVDPRELFEKAIGWLAVDGVVIVSMFRGVGARYVWTRVQSGAVEQLAGCAVKDAMTGKVWDVKAFRLRPETASR